MAPRSAGIRRLRFVGRGGGEAGAPPPPSPPAGPGGGSGARGRRGGSSPARVGLCGRGGRSGARARATGVVPVCWGGSGRAPTHCRVVSAGRTTLAPLCGRERARLATALLHRVDALGGGDGR